MSETTTMDRPAEPDWSTLTPEGLAAFQEAENRVRASVAARAITGEPDPGATIEWRQVALPGRDLPVRVHRPSAGGARLPLVVQVHGGGFVGTAAQCDWANSHLAARLPAVVVAVEHRLLDWETPLTAAADDGWDVLRHVVEHAGEWGVDPGRVAVFGESFGGLITALSAIRARQAGLRLRAQVLVNPGADVTSEAFDLPSTREYPCTPTLTLPQLHFFRKLAVPEGADARALSPLHAGDLSGLAPALVVVPTADPVADHGRRYAERLQASGTPARLSEYDGAGHAFLSMPGMVPQAEPARAEILGFLRQALGG
ncbi:Alpha/beta hydrolase fold-3 domain protein [[Actinomadura] parvosata subsp. kistnae]|uniref:Alpha/beta hydrolase n=1 Tax=[Actinomadura] parvosata subsp. kistnae TaxID=1909395 RepID=A0A1V0AH49_9ACTN|nr:alpha/beta hydrolase [Nonomuraea sp. ATCC 55076]AQZ69547.1 alpha/beta hydrolase [Nonomuraea sp. ATCC 55076]SPL91776.1 Alpha/beta hydrolase fold-3 domain protein [Actinomadura parvosata subsp. kistnae]